MSVCPFTVVNSAIMTELMEMPFGGVDLGGPEKPCIRFRSISTHAKGHLRGKGGGPL